ncbi:PREDICTED: uncharacterized protein LOC106911977 [Poecilia mexicana]|uniref:uncharacterized protein LOC106911977 n=1 Tax=Poecilia mexicana TaxID=48701 RepID=UPI00072E258D|nr:PREDICTED: uncharacterized protein LOC106911977 [Poecilia mexicana]
MRQIYHISYSPETIGGLGLEEVRVDPGLEHGLARTNTGAYPLLRNSTGGQKYVPFPLGDRDAIVDKLPSITAGGSLWLAELDLLTSGMTLAMGDFRAIMSRCMSGMVMKEVEHAAGTQNVNNSTAVHHVMTPLARAIKKEFPLATTAPITKFEWDHAMDPKEYINKSAETWLKQTTVNPKGPHTNLTEMFREAILKGVPEQVVDSIKNNPDLMGCEHVRWERHLLHHLIKAQDELKKKQSDTKDLENQLLKLQLQEAKQNIGRKRKDQMMVAAAVTGPSSQVSPTQTVTPNYMQNTNQYMGGFFPPSVYPYMYPQNRYGGPPRGEGWQGAGRGRRGMGRGRGVRGAWSQAEGRDVCYICGRTGHWASRCWETQAAVPQQGQPGMIPHNPGVIPAPHGPGQYSQWDVDPTQGNY